jgi:single-stranded DNA-binding protein
MHAQITGIGRLIADPDFKSVGNNGATKTTLRVAVDHQGPKPDGAQYKPSDVYYVEIWGKRGEAATNSLSKGERVFFTGRLETSKGKDGGVFLNVRNAEWSFTGGKAESKPQEQEGGYDAEALPF